MAGGDDKRSYQELLETCRKLEAEVGHHLVMQRDLNRAKDGIDAELMRFREIQNFIAGTLEIDDDTAFYTLTLETIISAFEYEVALYLVCDQSGNRLTVACAFGLDDAMEALTYEPDWFKRGQVELLQNDHTILKEWTDLDLHQALICPMFDQEGVLAGAVLAGITSSGSDFYDPIVEQHLSAFGVLVRQAGAIWRNRQLTSDILDKNRRLEIEAGQQLVLQRDLVSAKDKIDAELMRFKAIQTYIGKALTIEQEAKFFSHTLESLIEAFEFEVAMLLRLDPQNSDLTLASAFGLADAPLSLPYSANWFSGSEGGIFGDTSAPLKAWSSLGLHQAMICPFYDKSGDIAGLIVGGITADGADYYDAMSPDQVSAYSVMVRQAGALFVNRELNQEIIIKNNRLVSLTDSYSRFVPFQFLDLLNRSSIEEIAAGDNATLDVSVLFLDIRGFTRVTELKGPADTFVWLNEFLDHMEPVIARQGGFINQYQGDAIMALFPGSSDPALRCAADMIAETAAYNERQLRLGDTTVNYGIGINSGELILGAIGGENRLESNVVGDTANLASRTEGLTKIYGVPVIFTEFTKSNLEKSGNFRFRELDQVTVKGRKGTLRIYELLSGNNDQMTKLKIQTMPQFAAALALYRSGDFSRSLTEFQNCLTICPDDGAAALFTQRCQQLANTPPPDNWQGISVIGEK